MFNRIKNTITNIFLESSDDDDTLDNIIHSNDNINEEDNIIDELKNIGFVCYIFYF